MDCPFGATVGSRFSHGRRLGHSFNCFTFAGAANATKRFLESGTDRRFLIRLIDKLCNAGGFQELGKATDNIVVGAFHIACRCEDSFLRVEFANEASEVLGILNVPHKAVVGAEERHLPMRRLARSVAGVVSAAEHTVRTPATIVDMSQVVTCHLGLAGLRRRRDSNRNLDGGLVVDIDLIILIL